MLTGPKYGFDINMLKNGHACPPPTGTPLPKPLNPYHSPR